MKFLTTAAAVGGLAIFMTGGAVLFLGAVIARAATHRLERS